MFHLIYRLNDTICIFYLVKKKNFVLRALIKLFNAHVKNVNYNYSTVLQSKKLESGTHKKLSFMLEKLKFP